MTREKVHVDRVACPWLIKRFIDPDAEFVFVPRDTDASGVTDAIPFDMKGAELTHKGEECSFDAIIHKYEVKDPVLEKIRVIVRLADTDREDENPFSKALEALATGYRLITKNDYETLEKEFWMYDALYAYLKKNL
jgi:hypothetical protein